MNEIEKWTRKTTTGEIILVQKTKETPISASPVLSQIAKETGISFLSLITARHRKRYVIGKPYRADEMFTERGHVKKDVYEKYKEEYEVFLKKNKKITSKEASKILGISKDSLNCYCRKYDIGTWHPNRKEKLYDEADIEALKKKLRTDSRRPSVMNERLHKQGYLLVRDIVEKTNLNEKQVDYYSKKYNLQTRIKGRICFTAEQAEALYDIAKAKGLVE